jgi:hypothetical protein
LIFWVIIFLRHLLCFHISLTLNSFFYSQHLIPKVHAKDIGIRRIPAASLTSHPVVQVQTPGGVSPSTTFLTQPEHNSRPEGVFGKRSARTHTYARGENRRGGGRTRKADGNSSEHSTHSHRSGSKLRMNTRLQCSPPVAVATTNALSLSPLVSLHCLHSVALPSYARTLLPPYLLPPPHQ